MNVQSLSNDDIQKAVQQGFDDLEAGQVIVCQTEDELARVFEDIKRGGRQRMDAEWFSKWDGPADRLDHPSK